MVREISSSLFRQTGESSYDGAWENLDAICSPQMSMHGPTPEEEYLKLFVGYWSKVESEEALNGKPKKKKISRAKQQLADLLSKREQSENKALNRKQLAQEFDLKLFKLFLRKFAAERSAAQMNGPSDLEVGAWLNHQKVLEPSDLIPRLKEAFIRLLSTDVE